MRYTNSKETMEWWYPHTKKLKYCLSTKFNEHKNEFGKGWSSGSASMNGTTIYSL